MEHLRGYNDMQERAGEPDFLTDYWKDKEESTLCLADTIASCMRWLCRCQAWKQRPYSATWCCVRTWPIGTSVPTQSPCVWCAAPYIVQLWKSNCKLRIQPEVSVPAATNLGCQRQLHHLQRRRPCRNGGARKTMPKTKLRALGKAEESVGRQQGCSGREPKGTSPPWCWEIGVRAQSSGERHPPRGAAEGLPQPASLRETAVVRLERPQRAAPEGLPRHVRVGLGPWGRNEPQQSGWGHWAIASSRECGGKFRGHRAGSAENKPSGHRAGRAAVGPSSR